MTAVIGGFVTSHATALVEPSKWDEFRLMVRRMYKDRYGAMPPEHPGVATESDEDIERRYARVRETQMFITEQIKAARPDAVVLLGNDQNENFKTSAIPQFAIYTGAEAIVHDWINNSERSYRSAPDIAEALLAGCVERGFDVVRASSFEGGKLSAHAHAQVYSRFLSDADVPVVPVFVNAITPPLPSARRCFEFGRAMRESIEARLPGKRVIIGASGGLSHFTAGFPYEELKVPRSLGTICAEFDRSLLGWIDAGDLARVSELTDDEILENGDVEFRQGIAFLGALPAGSRPDRLVYEPFYRGLMGFWAGYWDLGRH
ncbi:MAG: extradiol ring-cleavage dioxygenase [Alphaproteobacteria bacterium]|nr:extradiol ring-cleavage dioxygenase [Alphaproteobacteria bacterium]